MYFTKVRFHFKYTFFWISQHSALMEKSVSRPIVKCMSWEVRVHLENFAHLWKSLVVPLNAVKPFFFYHKWTKIRDPNNLRKITRLFHVHIGLKWVKVDAKFERALKSLNFTDDCMAHPIVEQIIFDCFFIF